MKSLNLVGFCWTADRTRPNVLLLLGKKNEKNKARLVFKPTINQSIANSLNRVSPKMEATQLPNKKFKHVINWSGQILLAVQQKPTNFSSYVFFYKF